MNNWYEIAKTATRRPKPTGQPADPARQPLPTRAKRWGDVGEQVGMYGGAAVGAIGGLLGGTKGMDSTTLGIGLGGLAGYGGAQLGQQTGRQLGQLADKFLPKQPQPKEKPATQKKVEQGLKKLVSEQLNQNPELRHDGPRSQTFKALLQYVEPFRQKQEELAKAWNRPEDTWSIRNLRKDVFPHYLAYLLDELTNPNYAI